MLYDFEHGSMTALKNTLNREKCDFTVDLDTIIYYYTHILLIRTLWDAWRLIKNNFPELQCSFKALRNPYVLSTIKMNIIFGELKKNHYYYSFWSVREHRGVQCFFSFLLMNPQSTKCHSVSFLYYFLSLARCKKKKTASIEVLCKQSRCIVRAT